MNRVFPGFLFLFFLCTCFSTLSLQAQDTTSLAPRWEVGINVLPIIRKQETRNPTILVRWRVNEHSAVRAQVGTNISFECSGAPIDNHFAFYPGYERVKYFSTKSSLHYGMDLQYERDRIRLYILDTRNSSAIRIQEFRTLRQMLGAGFFMGYRYMFLKNLSFYIETGFNYQNPIYRTYNVTGLISVGGVTGGAVQVTGFEYFRSNRIFFTPLQMVNLMFHF
jgi:hypothetical protein